VASRLEILYKTVKNLRILIRSLIKEYWGDGVDGSRRQQPHGDVLSQHGYSMNRVPLDVAPPPDKLNKTIDGEEKFEVERLTFDDYIEQMGLEDKDLPGKRYK
jgi:hypothetical protein